MAKKPTPIRDQIRKVMRGFDTTMVRVRDAVRGALYQEMAKVMRRSLRQVPVDTGRLRASAWLSLPTTKSPITIQMGYATDYAPYVHELPYKHNPPTKWHYLSDPLMAAVPGLGNRIARRAAWLYKRQGPIEFGAVYIPTAAPVGFSLITRPNTKRSEISGRLRPKSTKRRK